MKCRLCSGFLGCWLCMYVVWFGNMVKVVLDSEVLFVFL